MKKERDRKEKTTTENVRKSALMCIVFPPFSK